MRKVDEDDLAELGISNNSVVLRMVVAVIPITIIHWTTIPNGVATVLINGVPGATSIVEDFNGDVK